MNDPLVVKRRLFGRFEWFLLIAAVLLAGVVVPLAHALLPDGAALRPSSYVVTLAGKFACYAMLAVAMDLIWGYAGILSLGQSLWFALGGYVFGMHLMRGIGREAQHFSDKGRTGREGHDDRALHEKERCISQRLLLGGHLAAGHAPHDNRDERIALGIVHHHVSHRFLQSYR